MVYCDTSWGGALEKLLLHMECIATLLKYNFTRAHSAIKNWKRNYLGLVDAFLRLLA
jgi:hypothetical protein